MIIYGSRPQKCRFVRKHRKFKLNPQFVQESIFLMLQKPSVYNCMLDIPVIEAEFQVYANACSVLQEEFTKRNVTPVLRILRKIQIQKPRYPSPSSLETEDSENYKMLLLAFAEASAILAEASDFTEFNWRNALLGKAFQKMQEMDSDQLTDYIAKAYSENDRS